MKLDETTTNPPVKPIQLSTQQIAAIRQQMARLSPIEMTKLIKDLEDIKRGGSDWRKQPSRRGYD